MSNLDKLVAKGAYSCGGELLFKNKVMGRLRDGEFYISPEGLAELEVSDVEVKEVKPRSPKKAKAKAEPTMDAVDTINADDDLQDLLGE